MKIRTFLFIAVVLAGLFIATWLSVANMDVLLNQRLTLWNGASVTVGMALLLCLLLGGVIVTLAKLSQETGLAIERCFSGKGYWSAGFDLSEETLRLIKAGHIRFTIDQQPYVQGFYPVVQLTHFIRYGLVPSDLDAGAGIIDRSNVDRVDTHDAELRQTARTG